MLLVKHKTIEELQATHFIPIVCPVVSSEIQLTLEALLECNTADCLVAVFWIEEPHLAAQFLSECIFTMADHIGINDIQTLNYMYELQELAASLPLTDLQIARANELETQLGRIPPQMRSADIRLIYQVRRLSLINEMYRLAHILRFPGLDMSGIAYRMLALKIMDYPELNGIFINKLRAFIR